MSLFGISYRIQKLFVVDEFNAGHQSGALIRSISPANRSRQKRFLLKMHIY